MSRLNRHSCDEQDDPFYNYLPEHCRMEGCQGLAWGNDGLCLDCETKALEEMAGAPKKSSRLSDVLWAAASVAVVWWMLWETRSFWLEWIDMIFGVSQ